MTPQQTDMLRVANKIGGQKFAIVTENLLKRGVKFPAKEVELRQHVGVGARAIGWFATAGWLERTDVEESGLCLKARVKLAALGLRTREQVAAAIQAGQVHFEPQRDRREALINYGSATHRKVRAWAGMEPQ